MHKCSFKVKFFFNHKKINEQNLNKKQVRKVLFNKRLITIYTFNILQSCFVLT